MSCRTLCPMVESWRRELWSSAEKDQVRDHLDKLNIDKFLGLGFQECWKGKPTSQQGCTLSSLKIMEGAPQWLKRVMTNLCRKSIRNIQDIQASWAFLSLGKLRSKYWRKLLPEIWIYAGLSPSELCFTKVTAFRNEMTSFVEEQENCDVIFLNFNKGFNKDYHSILWSYLWFWAGVWSKWLPQALSAATKIEKYTWTVLTRFLIKDIFYSHPDTVRWYLIPSTCQDDFILF